MNEITNVPVLLWYLMAYGIVMVALGIYYSKGIKTSDDFILAGRSLGAVVLMGTLIATWMGSGTITGGQNSMAYSFGLWTGVLLSVGAPIGIFVLYLI